MAAAHRDTVCSQPATAKWKCFSDPTGAVLHVCTAFCLHINKVDQCFNKRGYSLMITDNIQ